MQLQRGWFRTAPKLTRRQKNTSIIREQGTTDRGNYFKDQQYKVDASAQPWCTCSHAHQSRASMRRAGFQHVILLCSLKLPVMLTKGQRASERLLHAICMRPDENWTVKKAERQRIDAFEL